jgi:hypothetical protein
MIMSANSHDSHVDRSDYDVGHLYQFDAATGAATDFADLADVGDQDYAWTAAHSALFENFPDANPRRAAHARLRGL